MITNEREQYIQQSNDRSAYRQIDQVGHRPRQINHKRRHIDQHALSATNTIDYCRLNWPKWPISPT